ncbi:acyl transferase/acyl hydrolase/lysophospholipase [Leptodontidium sp. 2 PMI_412]|nr:acyl transferase/acyl hydrolase/lysophospholipase [Leptodontidium sp. 2 PMI_412]
MTNQVPHPPVCLLSLDGGGIKGISELLILQHIMVAVHGRLGLAEEPRPCDYFDLVGGTSTGGLIAIMLARLRMTASEALQEYFKLAGKIFSKKNTKVKGKEGSFKASTLETSVRKIVVDREQMRSSGTRMLPTGDNDTRAKGFVCAMAAEMMKKPYHLRTYQVLGEILYDCEIWEAARATTAAPTYFKAISIMWPTGATNRFVDAGLGFNNPTEEIIEEAETISGASTPLRVLISLGCGVKSSIRYDVPSALDKFLTRSRL